MGKIIALAVFIVAMQVDPARAQQAQQERSRVVKVAHVLLVSGLTLSALDHGHKR